MIFLTVVEETEPHIFPFPYSQLSTSSLLPHSATASCHSYHYHHHIFLSVCRIILSVPAPSWRNLLWVSPPCTSALCWASQIFDVLSLCFKRSDERHKFNGGILLLQFYRRVLKIKGDLLCLSLVPVIYTYVLLWQMLLLNMAKVVKNEFGLLASMSLWGKRSGFR